MLKIYWIYNNIYKLNNQHDCGDLYNYIMNMKNFTLIINKMFIRASKDMRKLVTGLI